MKTLFTATKLALVMGAVGFAMPSYALFSKSCPVDPTFHIQTKPEWTAIKTAINASNNLTDTTMKESIKKATGLILEGRRVLTAQESITTGELVQAIGTNTEQEIAIRNAVDTSREMAEVQKEFSTFSTGLRNCDVITERERVARVDRDTKTQAMTQSSNGSVTARAGHYANKNEALATRLALHDAKYCTKEQAESGLCTGEAPRAGNSLLASTLFKPAEQGDENDQDKDALINNMVGLPDDPTPQGLSNSALGIAYEDAKRQKDSLKSIGIYALKYVQAQTTGGTVADHDHEHESAGKEKATTEKEKVSANADTKSTDQTPEVANEKDTSYSGLVRKDVEKHFGGGDSYITRRKYIASATEKGVLVEMNKASGLLKKQLADLIEKEQIKLSLTAGQTVAMMRYTGMDSKIEEKRQKAYKERLSGIANANQ